jgi:hypothetical protein
VDLALREGGQVGQQGQDGGTLGGVDLGAAGTSSSSN